VMTDTKDPEAKIAQHRLRTFDGPQLLVRDLAEVRNAG
jgi:hypothetical protein